MLSSIHPLGERSRNNRWSVTAAAFVIGATLGGAGLGSALGLVALPVGAYVDPRFRWLVVGLVAAVAVVVDLRSGGAALPSWQRQVNEDWLGTYRGWVYGLGFGLQLGVGLATYVTTALIYVMLVTAVASGTFVGALVVISVFGATRGIVLLSVGRVDSPEGLLSYHRRLARAARPARAVGGITLAAVAAVGLLVAI